MSVITRIGWASSPAVRKSMLANRSSGTAPELVMARALRRAGLKYRGSRTHGQPLPYSPDFVVEGGVCVFVDGCFWHVCPTHGMRPKTNRGYWLPKLDENRRRDRRATRACADAGLSVLRVWECRLRSDADAVAGEVAQALLAHCLGQQTVRRLRPIRASRRKR